MAGFFLGGALLGLASIAWPLYLHLRRRRQIVQDIPSLRLFAHLQRLNRRVKMQQLLLMLARIGLLVALCLVLAQPWFRSRRTWPLPLAPGFEPPLAVIGILVDDSLSAWPADAAGTRLDLARDWLQRQLAGLPEGARYRLTTTTGPYPSPLLDRETVLAALAAYRPLPRQGQAPLALTNLATELSGEYGSLLIAAPRSIELWNGPSPADDFAAPLPVHFLDTSERQPACFIQRLEVSSPGRARLFLGGMPERFAGQRLSLTWEPANSASFEVTPHDVLRGWMAIDLPADLSPATPLALALDANYEHPWFQWYFRPKATVDQPAGIVIFRRRDAAALTADKLVTAVMQSARPELPIYHVDPDATDATTLPDAAAIVCIGDAPPPALHPWLNRRLDQGASVLCVPDGGGPATAPAPSWYPSWGAEEAVVLAQALPLTCERPTLGRLPPLDDLLLAGLREMPFDRLFPLTERPDSQPLLVTADARAIVRLEPTEGLGRVVTFAFPLLLGERSPVYHPLFPLLIEKLALAGPTMTTPAAGNVEVGATVSLTAWFERPRLAGTLTTPAGWEVPVRCAEDQPQYLPIDHPGIYRLRMGGETLQRTANTPRQADDALFTREAWDGTRPNTPTVWLGPDDAIGADSFRRLGDLHQSREPRTYDLSPVAAILLLLAIGLEGFLLLRIWRAPEG